MDSGTRSKFSFLRVAAVGSILVSAILALALTVGGGNPLPASNPSNLPSGYGDSALPAPLPSRDRTGSLKLPDAVATQQSLPPTSTPDLRPPTMVLITPPPTHPAPHRMAPQPGLPAPNLAWGVETTGALTIWVGNYSDAPVPSVSAARPVVLWSTPLRLVDMAVSPDHRSLAVISVTSENVGEGDVPFWLSVIDLSDNTVQVVPSDSDHDLYASYIRRSPDSILGWLDNQRLAVQPAHSPSRAVLATADGTSYADVPFPPWPSFASESALSPDGSTFLSFVGGGRSANDGFWLYDPDGGNPRWVLDQSQARSPFRPRWSPDGRRISFVSPWIGVGADGRKATTYRRAGVWVFDLDGAAPWSVSGDADWNVAPAWSHDGSKIAFLRADAPITPDDGTVFFGRPEKVNTNVYITAAREPAPRRLTSFTGKKNTNLEWTPGGNLILSSTAGLAGSTGLLGLLAVNAGNGVAVPLLSGAPGQSLTEPVFFR